jgi:MFS family permease
MLEQRLMVRRNYPGFLVIYAKLSDILGTKLLILFAVIFFTVFSIACGVANTMLQLYG